MAPCTCGHPFDWHALNMDCIGCGCREFLLPENPAQPGGIVGRSRYDEGTTKDGPRRCANTVIQGPRRSMKEID